MLGDIFKERQDVFTGQGTHGSHVGKTVYGDKKNFSRNFLGINLVWFFVCLFVF